MTRQTLLAIGAVPLLVFGRAQAQAQQQPKPAPEATFRAEVNYVDIDVTVTDEQGNFVTGLMQDDFELLEDGTPQTIETFSYIDIPFELPERFLGIDDRSVSMDVRSNREPVSGRMYVIVLDDLDISFATTDRVKQEARRFIEQYFGAGDIAAGVHTSGGAGASQDFTNDPQMLLASIDRFIGRKQRSMALEKADEYYRQQQMKELQGQNNQGQGNNQSQAGDQLQGDTQTQNNSPQLGGPSAELRDVLDTPLQQSALTLSVHAAPFKHTDKEASAALTIEIDGESLRLPSDRASVSNSLELSFFGINDQGKATKGVRKELGLRLKPETQQRVKAYGIRLNPRISLAPGRYQLRIGVRETASGANGSVFYDLIVPDFRKEALVLSGLLLTSASAQRTPTAEPDPVMSKLLPGSVTSRRELPVGDTLAVYCEVYDHSSSRRPRQIDVAVRLISEGGTEVFTATDSMTSASSKRRAFPQNLS